MPELAPAIGWSVAKPGQPDDRNADCFSTLIHPNDPAVAFHIVCDGVSAALQGRAASRGACQRSVQRFHDAWTRDIGDSQFLRDTLIDAHDFVCQTHGTTSAHCTVVAALVNLSTEMITLGHAGDS
ncbi:MAG: hypothetical protein AAFX06_22790, partial [Planctomycetota bacterium]